MGRPAAELTTTRTVCACRTASGKLDLFLSFANPAGRTAMEQVAIKMRRLYMEASQSTEYCMFNGRVQLHLIRQLTVSWDPLVSPRPRWLFGTLRLLSSADSGSGSLWLRSATELDHQANLYPSFVLDTP